LRRQELPSLPLAHRFSGGLLAGTARGENDALF
jgi:hypothetical protein